MMKKLCRKIIKRLLYPLNMMVRHFRLVKQREKFANDSLSVFSSNCVGCCMLHDLGVRFNSPFVNLFLNAEDYLKFLQDPQKYSNAEFRPIKTESKYPMGMLGDLTLHFVHYKNYQEAVCAFQRRLKRINYDNLFVIFSERDGCTYEDLKRFDSLPYSRKVVFTHLPYEDIASAVYIEGFEKEDCLGDIITWDKGIGRRVYDRFDFAQWLNG